MKIRRAAVLGAAVMGSQISAHLADAGVRTYLLDLPSDSLPEDKKLAKAIGKNVRNSRAILAIEQMKKLKPSPLLSKEVFTNLIPGNFEDDMSVISECDWVLEAVVERIDIKKSIHNQINQYRRPGVPVCTNTSGIPLKDIITDFPEDYVASFFGTHFFNPPRYMKLLEVIPHGASNMSLIGELSEWITRRLGKGIVYANDTVNFIANRIGVFALQATIKHMNDLGLNVETVDALTGKLIGHPSSATFRTMDVVGLDVCAMVSENVYKKVEDDPYRDYFQMPAWINDLISSGSLGQKTKSKGVYLKTKDEKKKTKILSFRPETKSYEDQNVAELPWLKEAKKQKDFFDRLNFIIEQDDPGAKLIWNTLRDVFSYSALLLDEIASSEPKRVDDAIRWGFNWEWGVFETWQGLGFNKILSRMEEEGVKLPKWIKKDLEFYSPTPGSKDWASSGPTDQLNSKDGKLQKIGRPQHLYRLPLREQKEDDRVMLSNSGASLLDIGNGVALLNFHTKMNALDDKILEMLQKSVAHVSENFNGLVIANQGQAFSAGANLAMILEMINEENFDGIDQIIRQFQASMQLLKFAPFPVVACPHGMTLGGGCEVSLHASHKIVAAETYAGLVEIGVGLIPGAGGTKELALRAYQLAAYGENADPMKFLETAFKNIAMAKVSTSGFNAIELGLYNKENTTVAMSLDHQIEMAKEQVLLMHKHGYVPKLPATKIKVAGDPGINTFRLMLYNMLEGNMVSKYDAFIAEKIATVLCGGEVDEGTLVGEEWFLELERRVFVELCKEEKTKQRIEHMLKTGKPLRN